MSKNTKILICEDNAPLASLLKHLLVKRGFSVQTASDGREGLGIVRALGPDLLLLDLGMPEKDGFEVLQGLQTLTGKKPYTMVVSSHEGGGKLEKAKAMGAQEVWTKPFVVADLVARIDALIQQGLVGS